MGIINRLKFTFGIVTALLIGLGLFVYLEHSMSRVRSVEARLMYNTFTVGVGYSGVVEDQFVDEGDFIAAGDPLFEIRSTTLAEAIKDKEVAKDTLIYEMTESGNILVSAAAKGQIQEIYYRKGAFVPANNELALINIVDELYASSTYVLDAPDYSRFVNGTEVTVILPDNNRLKSTVSRVEHEVVDQDIHTTVHAKVDKDTINSEIFTGGTPVETVMHLSGETWFKRIASTMRSILD